MPEWLPLFPLGTVLFPGSVLPLHVFEPRYCRLVHDLLEKPEPRRFGVLAIREGHEVGAESLRSLYDIGCVALIRDVQPSPDGRFALLTVGEQRFRTRHLDNSMPYLQAEVEPLTDPPSDDATAAQSVREAFDSYAEALGGRQIAEDLSADATALSYAVAGALAIDLRERQRLLEVPSTDERLAAEREILRREIALMQQLHTMPIVNPPIPPSRLN